MKKPTFVRGPVVNLVLVAWSTASAQMIEPPFDADYALTNLGMVPGLPTNYGPLIFKLGDPQTILIGGDAGDDTSGIYEVTLTRDGAGHINGFSGMAVRVANAPGASADLGLDGGLAYGPDNVLFYSTYDDTQCGQIKPGEMDPARLIDLAALGVAPSTGPLGFVPTGFPNAGHLKIVSYDTANWYDATVMPDGAGTFNILGVTFRVDLDPLDDIGPEGFRYVHSGHPLFAAQGIIQAEYRSDAIATYEIDGSGDPNVASRRVVASGIDGPIGCAFDPVTGDLLVSTYGSDEVFRIQGFTAACVADSDGDGAADCNDGCPQDAAKTAPGDCGCGVSDSDDDGDGVPNCLDSTAQAAGCCAPGAFSTVGVLTPALLVFARFRRRNKMHVAHRGSPESHA
jgi:hypothetical protein